MKTAILTIDDVTCGNTPAMVDYLLKKKIKAVLFAVGQNVEQHYEEAIYALKAGFIIGNHSYTHPFFSKLTLDEGIQEIEKNEAVLNQLYRDANVERKYRPFRFPYGDHGGENVEALQQYLRTHGFDKLEDTGVIAPAWESGRLPAWIDTYWTFDFEEYLIRPNSGITPKDVMERIKKANPPFEDACFTENSRNIILLHSHDETEELFPRYYEQMVDDLLARGVVLEEPAFFDKD